MGGVQNGSSPVKVLALWLAALMVVAIAAVITITTVNHRAFGPEKLVSDYFGLLQAGDGEHALGLLGADVPAGNALLLDDAGLKAAVAPIKDFSIAGSREVTAQDVVVTAEYTVSNKRHTTDFHLTREGREWLFFDRWRFSGAQLPTVTITADTTNQVTVNGLPAPLAKGAAKVPVFMPAVVSASYAEKYFHAGKETGVVDSVSSAKGDGLELHTEPTQKLVDDIDRQIRAYVDDCAAQQVLKPAGCPLTYSTEARVAADTIHWKVTRYPKIEVGAYDGNWVLRPLELGVELKLVEQNLMTGAKQEKTVQETFGFTAKLEVSRDSVAVTPVAAD